MLQAFYSIMADVRKTIKRPSMFMTEGIVEEVSNPLHSRYTTAT